MFAIEGHHVEVDPKTCATPYLDHYCTSCMYGIVYDNDKVQMWKWHWNEKLEFFKYQFNGLHLFVFWYIICILSITYGVVYTIS